MCFSASASFLTAAATGLAGAWCLVRAPSARYLPLAAIPALFGFQQAVEGLIWLKLGGVAIGLSYDALASVFLLFGEALWPAFIPLAVLLVEPAGWRRTALTALLALGLLLSLGFAGLIALAAYQPVIEGDCIRYAGCIEAYPGGWFYPLVRSEPWSLGGLDWTVVPYALTVIGALLLSRLARVRWFGLLGGVGLAVSLLAHRAALVSVWCFFAAVGSLVILLAIEEARAAATRGAGAVGGLP